MADLARSERTPETEAVITTAWIWKWFDDNPTAFGVDIDCARLRAELDAEQAEGKWLDADATIADIYLGDRMRPFIAFVAAILCASAAVGTWGEGRVNEAWSYATDARYWGCRAIDAMAEMDPASPNDTVVAFAKLGAAARHAENHAMKRDAIDAFLRGNFATKDDAAEHIAGKVVPVKFRTLRVWLKRVTIDP
jgi:hypothetical protein